ncbi:DUF418 domain-containing protein [Sphingomonas sp. MMS24-JH45]
MTRFATLDAIRGVAVMGILLANIVAFGLPEAAYFSPLAWGGSTGADRVAWFFNFVLVEGRMRGLFSLLFGASMLLVIERAEAAGGSGATVHLSRMFWLFVIGCVHLYFFWWGDILAHYALIGAVAFLFHRLGVRTLVLLAAAALLSSMVQGAGGALALFASAPRATPAQVAVWDGFAYGFGVPPAAHLAAEIAALRGGFVDGLAWRWAVVLDPLRFAQFVGPETLSAMLLGMAAWRSGFLTGGWPRRRYVAVSISRIGAATLGYGVMGALTMARGFRSALFVFLGMNLVSAPFRLAGTLGYAALLVLLLHGRETGALAAVGRMAFSNYLGTTMLMDLVFCGWGLGMFARLDRASLYLLVPPVWALMLWWSPWWLRRYAYGPLEWAWRSLARGERQRFRKEG